MVGASDLGPEGREFDYDVFLGRTLNSQSASLHPGVKIGKGKLLWGQPDKMLGGNLRRTSIPYRGSRNTPSRFIQ